MEINVNELLKNAKWKTLCDNVSLEDAVNAVGASLQEAERKRDEWLAQQKAIKQTNSQQEESKKDK